MGYPLNEPKQKLFQRLKLNLEDLSEIPPRPMIFELVNNDPQFPPIPFLPKGKLAFIGGHGGTGKTALMMHLALTISLNSSSFLKGKQGMIKPVNRGRVALLFGEEDALEIRHRLKGLIQVTQKVDPYIYESESTQMLDHIHFYPLAGKGVLSLVGDEESNNRFDELKKSLKDNAGEGWDLIVVDPLSHFGGAEYESDNGQAVKLVMRLNELTKLSGNPTVLGIHHSAKGASKGRLADALRGSSALRDNARWVGILRWLDEDTDGIKSRMDGSNRVVELTIAKSNSTRTGLKVYFGLGKGVIHPISDQEFHLLITESNSSQPKKKRTLLERGI